MTGLQLLTEIRKLNTTVPVIMIITEGSRDKFTAAIGQGGERLPDQTLYTGCLARKTREMGRDCHLVLI
ncbi:MAG TPA: hypothetical protein VFG20_19380 [Planctomycetaceae bacterium]|nr:hypothetical protein [Planctomycetaceae bacterium]